MFLSAGLSGKKSFFSGSWLLRILMLLKYWWWDELVGNYEECFQWFLLTLTGSSDNICHSSKWTRTTSCEMHEVELRLRWVGTRRCMDHCSIHKWRLWFPVCFQAPTRRVFLKLHKDHFQSYREHMFIVICFVYLQFSMEKSDLLAATAVHLQQSRERLGSVTILTLLSTQLTSQ